jgi:hypothetical protein
VNHTKRPRTAFTSPKTVGERNFQGGVSGVDK